MRRSQGFTLIETLIALVVAATAAAVILTQLRGLVAREEQVRRHEMSVLRLLNESVWLSLGSPGGERVVQEDPFTLRIFYPDPARPPVQVHNFSADGRKVPPLALAYTPFQRYSVATESYEFSVVAPAVRREDAIKPAPKLAVAGAPPTVLPKAALPPAAP